MALHLETGSVDLHYVGIDLRVALDELFSEMGVWYTLPPEVEGTVTLDLHHATYEQALQALLGHRYIYTIGPHDVIYIHRAGTSWRPGNEHID